MEGSLTLLNVRIVKASLPHSLTTTSQIEELHDITCNAVNAYIYTEKEKPRNNRRCYCLFSLPQVRSVSSSSNYRLYEFVAVYYYNFALKDYGDATMGKLLDMVKVVAFAVQEGRVAIHCHAGKSIFHTVHLTQLDSFRLHIMVF